MKKHSLILGVMLVMFMAIPAFAMPTLVSETWNASNWGYAGANDAVNMTAVFGAGNYMNYLSYASATPSAIFTASNKFVMLDGGAASDLNWYSYLTANSTTILSWVSAGGHLLLMSAGWDAGTYTFGPGSLIQDNYAHASYTGTLTAAGIAAFTFQPTPTTQSGSYLAHDYITGTGLTVFMTGNSGLPIIAGTGYGAGYLMYAGLTDSVFNSSGPGLVNDLIYYTATVPLPPSVLLLGSGLLGLLGFRRFRKG
jgi:hypothetical protein